MPVPHTPLPRSFFNRDPRLVARELIGKLLVRRLAPVAGAASVAAYPTSQAPLLAGRIVEAEAYLGLLDPGAHAYRGITPRNAVLFGPPGHAYVYFIYGNHFCTNISCQPAGQAGCILLRALEPVSGLNEMAALRGLTLPPNPSPAQLRRLTSGPGRLSQALAITRPRDNAKDLCSRTSDLYIAADSTPAPRVSATPRINVTRAPHDLWRFILAGNPFVSGPRAAQK
jgi:DNA-3-methyladenine glycosylase